ncbi:MAG: hypothetical protein WC985_10555 [Thermoplasmata archaeon]
MDSALLSLSTRATRALARLQAAGRVKSIWLPGMLTHLGRLARAIPEGSDVASWIYVAKDYPGLEPECDVEKIKNCVLDLSDPLTAAGLIVLVREAWGDDCGFVQHGMNNDGQRLCWARFGTRARDCGQGATELEALVAALEYAAERWAPLPVPAPAA